METGIKGFYIDEHCDEHGEVAVDFIFTQGWNDESDFNHEDAIEMMCGYEVDGYEFSHDVETGVWSHPVHGECSGYTAVYTRLS